MQCGQDSRQSNVESLNNVRPEGSRHFRTKRKAYLKAKIEEFEIKSKKKYIRDFIVLLMILRRVTSI
jgi:hypothetical protein